MNRRGISTAAAVIGAVVVLGIVAVVAFAAGASMGERGSVGFMRNGPGHMFGGFGGFGGIGAGLSWLVLLLLIGGIVWGLVWLLRPSEPEPPRYVQPAPPPGMAATSGPPLAGPPVGAPPAGFAEAFEAWHRQAHAADTAASAGEPAASPGTAGNGEQGA